MAIIVEARRFFNPQGEYTIYCSTLRFLIYSSEVNRNLPDIECCARFILKEGKREIYRTESGNDKSRTVRSFRAPSDGIPMLAKDRRRMADSRHCVYGRLERRRIPNIGGSIEKYRDERRRRVRRVREQGAERLFFRRTRLIRKKQGIPRLIQHPCFARYARKGNRPGAVPALKGVGKAARSAKAVYFRPFIG